MNETSKPRSQTCTSHCAGCDRHFHGDRAFDLHRIGQCCNDPVALRGKKGQVLLQEWTHNGICTLQKGCRADGQIVKRLQPVTIWQTWGSSFRGSGDSVEMEEADSEASLA